MKVLGLIVLATVSTSVFAQGVKFKKAWDEAKAEVTETAKTFKEKCGGDVKVSWDEKSFPNDNVSVAAWCKDSLSAAAALCEDADYKAGVNTGVKNFVCKYDAGLKTDSANNYGNKLELKGGTLTHVLNKDTANAYSASYEWLKNNL